VADSLHPPSAVPLDDIQDVVCQTFMSATVIGWHDVGNTRSLYRGTLRDRHLNKRSSSRAWTTSLGYWLGGHQTGNTQHCYAWAMSSSRHHWPAVRVCVEHFIATAISDIHELCDNIDTLMLDNCNCNHYRVTIKVKDPFCVSILNLEIIIT